LAGRRSGAEFKRAVVEFAFARQGEGSTIREIAEELGLSTGLLGKWLRHARLRLSKGKIPVRARRVATHTWRDQGPAAAPSAAGSSSSQAISSAWLAVRRYGGAGDRGNARDS
jgi:transposase-like protein